MARLLRGGPGADSSPRTEQDEARDADPGGPRARPRADGRDRRPEGSPPSELPIHLPRQDLHPHASTATGTACTAIGMAGRILHDLRRSGVKHYIDAGADPHTVMLWSGHRPESMLRRYHVVDLDDLRRAGKKASDYRGPRENVIRGDFGRTAPEPPQDDEKSRAPSAPSLSLASANNAEWQEWSRRESNPRPLECHSSALPTELRPHKARQRGESLAYTP